MLRQVPVFLKQKFKAYVATQVPASVAACEFECQVDSCPAEKWEVCEKRRQKAAAIAHMPDVVLVKSAAK